MPEPAILVVEDDPSIGNGLRRVLQEAGYLTELVTTGAEALEAAEETPPDLIILDLGLPDVEGIDLCRRLRADHADSVIIILTARDTEVDVVVGLDAGADDYITKPFGLAELLARVRANLRHRKAPASEAQPLVSGGIAVDVAARKVTIDGSEIDLRPREFDLLLTLLENLGAVVRREDIMASVWDEHWFGSTKTLDVHMVSLRRKLGPEADRIVTLRGVGYRLEEA